MKTWRLIYIHMAVIAYAIAVSYPSDGNIGGLLSSKKVFLIICGSSALACVIEGIFNAIEKKD